MSDNKYRLKRTLERHERRRAHVHRKVFGTSQRPRLVVYRSNAHIYAQIVDDERRITITGCSTLTPSLREKISVGLKKIERAKLVGERIAKIALEKGIKQVTFDRNGRRYHGRVKALAEAARGAGLEF